MSSLEAVAAVTTLLREPTRVRSVEVVAHRGFSSRQPEMTLAAYREAVEWSVAEGVAVGLECDVRFSADQELVCLHDPVLGRTSPGRGAVAEWSVAALRALDFGSWRVLAPSVEQRSLVTLGELLALVAEARTRGADVRLVVETKHPSDEGLTLERRVCELLAEYGWTGPGAPVRVIT